MKDKLQKYLLPNLPYLFFVYLFDKLCQAVRLAPDLDASEKFLHLSQGFTGAFSSGLPSLHPQDHAVPCAIEQCYCHDRIRATYAYSVQFSALL